jgi:hypothetical protein
LQAPQSKALSDNLDSAQSSQTCATQSQFKPYDDSDLNMISGDGLPDVSPLHTGPPALAENTQARPQAFDEGAQKPNGSEIEHDPDLENVDGVGQRALISQADASYPVPLNVDNPDFEKWINSFDLVKDFMRQYDQEFTTNGAQAEPHP